MEDMTPREMEDEKMVSEAYQHLIDTYLASHHRKHTEIIDKAFNFAKQAHKGVRRLSGEPYIMHPIAVAQIACEEIGLGSTGICSALLHDVVEDTDYTVEDIANIFGPKIAQIVDGLTKISGGIFGDKASVQAESFKKLLLTMSEDIRVILIKISDRLHNMRTLGSQLPGKQYKIAGETLYIYAPLAHRLGLNKVKEELEDLSFRYEHPEEYSSIQAQLDKEHDSLIASFESFTVPIRQKLDAMHASRSPTASGTRCRRSTSPSTKSMTSWPCASSSRWKKAWTKPPSASRYTPPPAASTSPGQTAYATGSPPPRPTATKPCTPPS